MINKLDHWCGLGLGTHLITLCWSLAGDTYVAILSTGGV